MPKLSAPQLGCVVFFAASLSFAQPQPVIQYIYGGSLNTVAPGEISTIFGTDLLDPAAPSSMKVLVNGVSAPFYANPSCKCVNFQIPPVTPLGTATIVISVGGAVSSPVAVSVKQYAPESSTNDGTFSNARHSDGTPVSTNSPAAPGERIVDFETGFGAAVPPPMPSITLGGFPTTVEDVKASQFQNVPGLYEVTFAVPPDLTSGNQTLLVSIGGVISEPRQIPVLATGLVLSQRGTTFNAVVGSTAAQQRSIFVLAPSSTIDWTATASTLSGGNWLQVTPAAGTSDPSHSPAIQITANANGLSPDDYYGLVTIKPVGTNSAQILMIVLNVLPATQSPGTTVEPTGLVFLTAPGAALPGAQTVQIANPTTDNLSFTVAPSVPSGAVWFKFSPGGGTVAPGQVANITVQPSSSLPAGTYPGALTLQFSDGKTRVVNLLFVIAVGAGTSNVQPHEIQSATSAPTPQVGCTPTKLLPVFTLLGVNFTSPVAWPTPIQAQIVDDCGTPIKTGSVTLTFSNGDPALGLVSLQNGTWANTWVPRKVVTSALVVNLKAQLFTPALEGTTTVSGSAPPNPEVPIINSGGVVGTASYVASPAPGTLISIFGTSLADGLAQANALPLPNQLGTSALMIGGVTVPLVFVSENQMNALVPYGLQTGKYQVIVQHANAISTPETIAVLNSQPAVFTTDQTGKGQGHIYKIRPDGAQILAAPSAPAHAGDVLTIYCTGLGEVNPPVQAGVPAPLDTLEPTVNPVTVTIGGVNAQVLFSGLTPGFTGLYQINVVVPDGVPAGSSVPVAVSAAGQQSIPVNIAMQ